MRMMPNLACTLCLLALMPLLASCAGAKPKNEHRLIVTMTPPELKAGQLLLVTARPEPAAEMAWVSGTVKVMGAPVMPFRRGADGIWAFKTMIPAFASLTPGKYVAEAWGDSKDGQHYEGILNIDVK